MRDFPARGAHCCCFLRSVRQVESFTKHNGVISDRAFGIGVVAFLLLSSVAVRVFGDVPSVVHANSGGTLLGSVWLSARPDLGTATFSAQQQFSLGALTLRPTVTVIFASEPTQRGGSGSVRVTNLFDRPVALVAERRSYAAMSRSIVPNSATSSVELSATAIALGEQAYVVDDEGSPVPEPATWFAAALLGSGVAWSQRSRVVQSLGGKSTVLIFVSLLSVLHADASNNWLGAWPQRQAVNLEANLWSGPDSRDLQFIDSNFEIFRTSGDAFVQQSSSSSGSIKLVKNQTMLVNAAPGETVTLSLKNFTMSGNSTLTLQGTASSYFVINVSKQFSLTGSAHIALAGNVCWNQVFFKIAGTGTVSIGGHSSLTGVLNAAQRTVMVTDHATILGTVAASKVFLRGAGKIITPPVVSQ